MSIATQFTRFYANSCSTTMTMQDFWSGASNSFDHLAHYHGCFQKRIKHPSVFAVLLSLGWNTGYFGSSPFNSAAVKRSGRHVDVNDTNLPKLVESMLREFKHAKARGRPFAAYYWDDTSHLAFPCEPKNAAESIQERMSVAYRLIDAGVARVLKGIIDLGLWDDTIIVGFGDHGDEPWTHGLNRGYAHSIAPYTGIVWTPMFIFDSSQPASVTDRIASVIDLKEMIVGYMTRDVKLSEEEKANIDAHRTVAAFSGFDVFSRPRTFAVSQNLFALQLEYDDPERGMTKNYAVTDGTYRLVVSSGGETPRLGGMELFYEQMDPTNGRNLLDFFQLDEDGEIIEFKPPPDAVGKHFFYSFRPEQTRTIIEAFTEMKKYLKRVIRIKEGDALHLVTHREEYHLFPDSSFTRAKARL